MALLQPFLKLIRWPNLVFIILTQSLFEYCIYRPVYAGSHTSFDWIPFALLVVASVFIAAAGYIINDYFDINIDLINKPQKTILGTQLSRRWALAWHLVLSILGIVCTAIAVSVFSGWYLIIANILCVLFLWFYSARFKKDTLIGNIIVSLMTAWVIMIIFLSKYSLVNAFNNSDSGQIRLFRFAILYAGFAFVISLIREAIKDIEDMPGDTRFGCRTMPIVWGINATKIYIAIWIVILMAVLLITQFYVLQFGWWLAVIYCLVFIIVPLGMIFKKLLKASTTEDYHRLSSHTKWVMLTGILSMLVFYFYL
ncbi:MAG TPA: geranylgeranylglycerol-phosphate geranylgeranyltransferase [Niabella sp.]|nr:geranylgeranylglycerol-phosphate geranylgeranyltransferase [Niabella sp.]HQW13611.1 geranylgeranylglycerol-phosphate geranylgeranyltransferase [Niabella sp.]HQX19005.1 geranylgeranylglycerol-phosphate geranylgeranyltransferase [Niabella sp.]HQX42419.1 geranylgeranylglycerol-phosphate geranylgeranyltransferase [Niabella sp.]HRB06296.1 geranylgeranylglycerol-phosphate geranylgeranyltransferase [Niabella sp.]